MSSLDRPLSGAVLRFQLAAEREITADPAQLERQGRSARTLVKQGPLRVTVVALRGGGHIAPHRADGPITVHVLDGDIRFQAAGQEHRLSAGDLLAVGAGLEHEVRSDSGGSFLLTLVQA